MNRWFDNFSLLGKYASGKVILSFFMVLLAVILGIFIPTTDRTLCVFAMGFSFIGDYTLDYNFNRHSKKLFVIGGTAFIIAHFFYFFAYNTKIINHGFAFFNIGVVLAIIVLVFATLVITAKARNTRGTKLYYFGLAYLWLTGINYMAVFSYAFSINSIEFLALIGGLSFLASDVIIGCEKLLDVKSKLARELVWWLYPIGQILLIIMG